MIEYMLIIWMGSLHGGPAMGRFASLDECVQAAQHMNVLAKKEGVSRFSGSYQETYICMPVQPLSKKP